MYRRLKSYIGKVEGQLDASNVVTSEDLEEMLVQIGFFQQERIVHLWITLAYALFFLISLFFLSFSAWFSIIPILLICFLIPYVVHYFHLENGVQYLYKLYNRMLLQKNTSINK